MRAGKVSAFLLSAAVAGSVSANLSAHRLDEYLQAARIGIEPDCVRIELALTPGVAIAHTIVGEIDRDNDGSLTAREQQAYAREKLRNIELRIDGTPLSVQLTDATFPDRDGVRNGEGTIILRSHVNLPVLAEGHHQLFFRNANESGTGVYLANALVPDDERLAITAQDRDGAQSQLTIDFVMSPSPAPATRGWTLMATLGAGLLWAVRRAL